MADKDYMTSREICTKYGINKYTLQNWRRGFYFTGGKKWFYFEDGSFLEANWNDEVRQLEYNPLKVAIWYNKLKGGKKHEA